MATQSIAVLGLTPGQNYNVSVYAVRTDSDGIKHVSPYSVPLQITSPGVASNGSNFSVVNSGTDIRLGGGSILAGNFPASAGKIDVVNGTTTATGVVLNQTGLAGFNNGVKEFYIDAATGKAYFAGTVTAGTVIIGPNIDPTHTKSGIYINANNYWYSDGSWSARGADIAGALVSSTIAKPYPIASVTAAWTGTTLNVTWTRETTGNYSDQYLASFKIKFTIGSTIKTITVPASAGNSYQLTVNQNKSIFGPPQRSFDSIGILAEDSFGNQTAEFVKTPIPSYVNNLVAPTGVSMSSVNNGYKISYLNPDNYQVQIEEATASSTGPWSSVYIGSLNPATVIAQNLNDRYVRIAYIDDFGFTGPYANAGIVSPTPPVSINNTAPNSVTITSQGFSNSGYGNNVVVGITLPASNPGTTFIVQLTTGTSSAYYYFVSDTNSNQTLTILGKDIFAQFGSYSSTYSLKVYSQSSAGIKDSGVTLSPGTVTRLSSLSSYTATASFSNIPSGYTITSDYTTTSATHMEVYSKYTSWSGVSSIVDYYIATYSSKPAANQLVLNAWFENGSITPTVVPTTGYKITGPNIPANTYVTAVSGSLPTITLTLSNNLTGTPSAGSQYNLTALVYSGSSPASTFSDLYVNTYVIIRWYDDFGNSSIASSELIAHPIDPSAISSISNAVNVSATNGAIYVGDSATSGKRVVINATGSYPGLFAFDGTNTSATTQIIANPTLAASGGYTFITTSAKIADWYIDANKIQNSLQTSSNYVGMSGNGTYAFWAGSSTSGGDALAKFTVTPQGAIVARNIAIYGDGTGGTSLEIGGTGSAAPFSVTSAGAMKATSATISGEITATSGNITGNLGLGGSFYSGTFKLAVVTGVVANGTTAVYTTNVAHGLTVGKIIYVANLSNTNLNGTYKITNVTTSSPYTFTVANTTNTTVSGQSGQLYDITSGFVMGATGLVFNNNDTKGVTTIDAATGRFVTQSALIAGWTIDSSTISATYGSGTISLSSGNALSLPRISLSAIPSYPVYLSAATVGSDIVFSAGNGNFSVKADGTVNISGPVSIGGYATTTDVTNANSDKVNSAQLAAGLDGKVSLAGIPAALTSTGTYVNGGSIRSGEIKSTTYSAPTTTIFSNSGMNIRLDGEGSIISKNFVIDATGSAYFKGTIDSSSITTGSSGYYVSMSANENTIKFQTPYTGGIGNAGYIRATSDASNGTMYIQPPQTPTNNASAVPFITISTNQSALIGDITFMNSNIYIPSALGWSYTGSTGNAVGAKIVGADQNGKLKLYGGIYYSGSYGSSTPPNTLGDNGDLIFST
jgi:hypothetical protein